MGEVLKMRKTPEMEASLIQEHADIMEQVDRISERARLAVEEAEVEAAPLMERAEEIERFLGEDRVIQTTRPTPPTAS